MHYIELINLIEQTAPPSLAADWDNSGVQVAGKKQSIKKLALALDPCLKTISIALKKNADFILCHHPLTLKPRLPNRLDSFHAILSKLLKQETWLYSAHTSLDANPDGPVNWLGARLSLKEMMVLAPTSKSPDQKFSGFGCIGQLPETTSIKTFLSKLHSILPEQKYRLIGDKPENVKKLAYCPGSGADLANRAFSLGADIYITGDIKYHQAMEIAELGFAIDVGHFILEEKMMYYWYKQLKSQLDIEVFFIPGSDPFYS
jgi:dinuclear metal center YbgI/SA1388 family protein